MDQMVDQNLWGSHMWHCIHMTALGYPAKPSEEEKRKYKQFFVGLQYVLPCATCAKHYAQNFKSLPIEPYLESNIRLFEWTVRLHNIVNSQLGKPEHSLEDSLRYYTQSHSSNGSKSMSATTIVSMILAIIFTIVAFFSHKK